MHHKKMHVFAFRMINISANVCRQSHVLCFTLFPFFFFKQDYRSTEDEGDSVFPKVRLGYANDCLACICGKPAQQLFIF